MSKNVGNPSIFVLPVLRSGARALPLQAKTSLAEPEGGTILGVRTPTLLSENVVCLLFPAAILILLFPTIFRVVANGLPQSVTDAFLVDRN